MFSIIGIVVSIFSIVNVDVFVVFPSSAVTVILNVFCPSFNVFAPAPVIFCPSCPLLAYISIFSVSYGTSVLYVNVFALNPEKSFGLIPKFESVATFDFVGVCCGGF